VPTGREPRVSARRDLKPDVVCTPGLVEAAFVQLMATPSGRELASLCYYEWDVLRACRRFDASEEWQAVRAIVQSFAQPGARALDIGAGNGIGSYALAQMGFGVTAVEPDPSRLVGYGAIENMVRASGLPIKLSMAVGEHLPFCDGSFTLVYARQVLHHARDLCQMTAEIARVLKPGGTLIACREHVVDDPSSLAQFLRHHPLQPYSGGEWAFRVDDYVGAIRSAGMSIKRIVGPWGSVINHYPVSNALFQQQMQDDTRRQWGALAPLVSSIAGREERYRSRRSRQDHTPGRLFSFVAER
jgi:ubiquinone/menaquinone biosynthesis C-methylase UbiE